MKIKILILGLILFLVFLYCKSPLSPELNENLPIIHYFKAEPETIRCGDLSILSWRVSNAIKVELDDGENIISVQSKDSKEVYPKETTAYKLIASNNDGFSTQEIKITIIKAANLFLSLYYIDIHYPYVEIEGIIRNKGNATAEDIYIHVKLIDSSGNQLWYEKYLVIHPYYGYSHLEKNQWIDFNKRWDNVDKDICEKADYTKSRDSIKVTWVNK